MQLREELESGEMNAKEERVWALNWLISEKILLRRALLESILLTVKFVCKLSMLLGIKSSGIFLNKARPGDSFLYRKQAFYPGVREEAVL